MYIIADVILASIMSFLSYASVVKFSSLKFSKIKFILYICCVTSLTVINKTYDYSTDMSNIRFIGNFFIVAFSIYFILLRNLVKSVYYTLTLYTLIMINDSLVVFIFVKVMGYTFEKHHSSFMICFLTNIGISILTYTEIILIKVMCDKKKIADVTNRNAAHMAFALMTFIVAAINIMVYSKYMDLIDRRLMLISIHIMTGYFILTMAVYRVYSNLVVNEKENEQLRVYINMVDELIDEYRRVRHNTYNIIEAASAFLEEDDMEGLKEHFSGVIERQRSIKKSNIASLYKIAHPGIKSLLSSKLGRIEALSLNLNLEITTDLEGVKANISDLCEILGAFLDRAIESAALTNEKYMEFCIFEDDQYYIIIIKNSYDPSHEKKDAAIGLKTADSIIRKYSLMLNNTITEKNYHIQELVIKKQTDNF
ncbi:GHKL domain-containing protein [Lutispora thermophila]|uniref:Sensor histidine kinase YesM n=1 Tax=Lutispora thermophila DSM 19022 TaxID=1122184 RepID=A0A1M6DNU7_9FIRM|nr:GHKL domain-containing protein [Lutispora thermophila]SHI74891.1 Sensor histidine kinase YesM [Lutispora thermophila DSM 19022]